MTIAADPILAAIQAPPAGYRYMLAHEAERLSAGDPIVLWNGEKHHGLVWSFTEDTMHVKLRSGAVIALDLDVPDFWPDNVSRDRRPPLDLHDGIVAISEVLATPDEEIEPLLRVSTALAGLAKTDAELAAAVAEVRRILLNRLKDKAA